MQIFVFAMFTFLASLGQAQTERKTFSSEKLETINLTNQSGDITVQKSKDNKSHVTVEKVNFSEDCRLTMGEKDNVLTVKVSPADKNSEERSAVQCRTHLTLKTPSAVAVNVVNGSGDIKVSGSHGALSVKSGNGDIKINSDVDSLKVKSGLANLEFNGLADKASIELGSGQSKLLYKGTPPKGQLDIKVGMGDTTVLLPAGSKLSAELTTPFGTLDNEFENSDDARFKVSMEAGSGDLTIKKAAKEKL